MRRTIDLALVPCFVEVVRQGGFTAAGAHLGLPKSTVSRRVSRLEADLGVPLLVRTTRTVRTTDAGQVFFERAARAMEQVEEGARELAEQRAEPRGVLRITTPPNFDEIGAIVGSFLKRYPEVRVEVSALGRAVDLVKEGYDLAIRAGQLHDSAMIARKLIAGDFALHASEAFLAEHGEPTDLGALAELPAAAFRSTDGLSHWSLEGPEGTRRVTLRSRFQADDLYTVACAAAAGVGVALIPRPAARRFPALRRVLPDYRYAAGAVYLVYPATRHVPTKVSAFRDHLLEWIAAHPQAW